MPTTEQLLYQTEKSHHQRFSTKTLFLKFFQHSWENTCLKFLRTPILNNICVWLLLNWLYKVIVWNFVSGLHLKPSWLSNINMSVIYKNTSRFQNRALNKIWHICPLCFLVYLGFVCSSLMVTTQKANPCSPCTPCLKM